MKLLEPPPVDGESPARLPLTTPGVRLIRSAKLRVAIGRLVTSAVVTLNERSPLLDWTSGASPLTTTVSAAPPTSNVIVPTAERAPGLNSQPEPYDVLNDASVTSMV